MDEENYGWGLLKGKDPTDLKNWERIAIKSIKDIDAADLDLIGPFQLREEPFYEGTKKLLKFELALKDGWIMGCKEGKKLFIWACSGEKKGAFKACMDFIVEHYKTHKVEFTNVISEDLERALHGFKWKKRYWKVAGETIINLVGRWK